MKNIEKLLDKFRDRSISEDEMRELEKWLNSHQVRSIQNLSEEKIEESLASFERSIYRKKVIRLKKRTYITVAASLLIVIGISIGVYKYKSEEIQHTAWIEPASGKATLSFKNGEEYVVDALSADTLMVEKGVYISNDSIDGLQVYQKESVSFAVYHTLQTPEGGVVTLNLEDGTRIDVNADTKIIFPNTFAGLNERKIYVEGEAFLKVEKDEERPFKVISGEHEIEVLGTEFNINSYAGNIIQTTLKEGSVKVSLVSGGNLMLAPGEQSTVQNNRMSKRQVDLNQELDWKNGDFYFDRTPLSEVMLKLKRWYNIEVSIPKNKRNIQLNGVISRKRNLQEVLNMLEKTGRVKFESRERRVIVI